MNKIMKKNCDHFCLAFIAGKPKVGRFEILPGWINKIAAMYYVGLNTPDTEKRKWLKEFKKFKYCPKCGEKLDYPKVEKALFE